ncbi:MAG: NAD(P)/FAD-dependent oxidoreductase [Acidimicrobiia bacterium]|nr:NAD(P)/FAD-dependent oxidoreductase [Acidimicrobiia bacterium]
MTQATTVRPAVDPTTGEPLEKRSTYDFVVVGGGPNGLGIAAYLAKWGYSVCMLEARNELGGGAETAEPIPGYSIDPHAVYFYGAAGPALEQLDLASHGFRMSFIPNYGGCITHDHKAFFGGNTFHEPSMRDPEVYVELLGVDRDTAKMYLEFMEALRPRMRDFFRSIYWTPPYDESWNIPKSESPRRQGSAGLPADVRRRHARLVVHGNDGHALAARSDQGRPPRRLVGQRPAPVLEGDGTPRLACTQLQFFSGCSPVGGMHALAHALARCALAHGAKIHVNSPVSEVIVHDGVAKGVRVADEAALEEKTIWANMGVINGTHIKQFNDLVSSSHTTSSFRQRIDDLSLKGGSLFVANLIVNELPEYTDAPEKYEGINYPTGMALHCTTDALMELMRDVYTYRTHPTDPDHYISWFIVHGEHDNTRVRNPQGGHVITVNLQVPVPEDHRDGPDAVNKAKFEILDNIKSVLRHYAPNMTEDKYIATPINTPYDSEQRNMGFVGGNWMGMRQSEDEWWERKPLPELARYRTPIDNLYLCNQTSYPGGLCLNAVPYNLMHTLKEDYAEIEKTTPEWWYPSPWHITDEEGAAMSSPGASSLATSDEPG